MTRNPSSLDLTNFLLGLAWLGELDRHQIQRLWFADKSESTVQKTLAELRKDELITLRSWSIRDAEKGVTAPQPARWSLTPQGHALVRTSDQYPAKPSRPRQRRLIEHDARTIETVVQLILLARRTGLCGVFLRYEVRLAPDRPRPIADAFVCIQTGATGCAPNIVPWSNDAALRDEQRWRFVIEGDNATEPAATIRGKGETYYQLFNDSHWRSTWIRQFGPLPHILWVVPHEARSEVIREQFSAGTRNGIYYLTTDANLENNQWQFVERGLVRATRIGLPAPKPSLPPVPPQVQATQAKPLAVVAEPALPTTETTVATPTTSVTAVKTPAPPTSIQSPPPTTTVQPPTIADYAAAEAMDREQRWRLWREGTCDIAVWLGQSVWWLCCLLPRGLYALWMWYWGIEYETRSMAWRVLLAGLLVFLLWAAIAQPPQLIALARAAIAHIGIDSAREPSVPTVALTPNTELNREPSVPTVAQTPNTVVAPPCPRMRVRGARVNLRAEPSLEGKVVRQLRAGDVVTVLDCSPHKQDGHSWWLVDDGSPAATGWVAQTWLESVPAGE